MNDLSSITADDITSLEESFSEQMGSFSSRNDPRLLRRSIIPASKIIEQEESISSLEKRSSEVENLSRILFPNRDKPKKQRLLKLTRADMEAHKIQKRYDEVPDVIEYSMPETYEVLPLIRCLDCGGNIFRQSQAIRTKIDAEQARIRKKTSEEGLERGMSIDEYNSVITGIIEEQGLRRPCCKMHSMEQLILPLDVPRSIERYVPSEGKTEPVGNVRIRYLEKKIPYNPYSFNVNALQSELDPTDEIEEELELAIPNEPVREGRARYVSDIYPSMPPIDDTFEEEEVPFSGLEGSEYVAGLVYTGVRGLESPLIKGRSIPAR